MKIALIDGVPFTEFIKIYAILLACYLENWSGFVICLNKISGSISPRLQILFFFQPRRTIMQKVFSCIIALLFCLNCFSHVKEGGYYFLEHPTRDIFKFAFPDR